MKTIIAGSRSCNNYDVVKKAIVDSGFDITTVISGGAFGVDTLGERYANEHGIEVVRFLPDWDTFGKRAGILRNRQMADNADALIAICAVSFVLVSHTRIISGSCLRIALSQLS